MNIDYSAIVHFWDFSLFVRGLSISFITATFLVTWCCCESRQARPTSCGAVSEGFVLSTTSILCIACIVSLGKDFKVFFISSVWACYHWLYFLGLWSFTCAELYHGCWVWMFVCFRLTKGDSGANLIDAVGMYCRTCVCVWALNMWWKCEQLIKSIDWEYMLT